LLRAKSDELEGTKSNETRNSQELLSYRDNIAHLVLSLHRLLEQKSVLAKMLAISER
jgi:hypothetical protein